MKWKHLPRYWPFVWKIHRSALIFSLICVWINDWVNNREAGDLRRHRAHYDAIVLTSRHNCLLKISHEKASVVFHNSDVIMRAMASQITSVSSACSTVCPSTDQSSASLAFVRGMTAIYRECAGTGKNVDYLWHFSVEKWYDMQINIYFSLKYQISYPQLIVLKNINRLPSDIHKTCAFMTKRIYRRVSNISSTLVGNKIVDHSDVVGASPVGAVPTTSSFSTSLAWAQTTTRRGEKHLSLVIWCVLY